MAGDAGIAIKDRAQATAGVFSFYEVIFSGIECRELLAGQPWQWFAKLWRWWRAA